jgi:alkyl sulfatase BDS1-like metallo-beta-lactamase superfamily hydrolase
VYDEPEFVVRNIWRQYGGWYDGRGSHLKPARAAELGNELARLAGGAGVLADRALVLAADGNHRLACHLADFAADASPDDAAVQRVRAVVYEARAAAEESLMARGIFSWEGAEARRLQQRASGGS